MRGGSNRPGSALPLIWLPPSSPRERGEGACGDAGACPAKMFERHRARAEDLPHIKSLLGMLKRTPQILGTRLRMME
jgi:hypothetical protein